MSIQLAHFFTTDSWLTCFVALCLLASCRAAERGTLAAFALAGCTYGLAMATKGSVVALVAPIVAAWLMLAVEQPDRSWRSRIWHVLPQAVVAALWPVRDEATPPLMDRFYTELARGVAPASALVRARRALSDVYPLDGAAFQLWLGARDMPWTAIASDTS